MNPRRLSAASALVWLALSRSAGAQTVEPRFDAQTYWPAAGPQQGLALRSADVQPHRSFGFTLMTNHAVRPLVYRPSTGTGDPIAGIDHAFTVDFLWSLGLFDRLQVMAALPMVAAQTGEGLAPITGGGAAAQLPLVALRDARIEVGVQLLRRERRTHASGAAVRADFGVSIPTGDPRFQGAASAVLQPMLVADFRVRGITVTTNVGARALLENRSWAGAQFPSTAVAGFGVAYRPLRLERLSVAADAQALLPVAISPQPDCGSAPCPSGPDAVGTARVQAELFAGARYAVDRGRDVEVTLGVGAPLSGAVGVPLVRALAGLAYTPRGLDDDRDGVREADDRCPSIAEDRDGFEDDDGCPELDNDSDRVADARDRCPNAPEDADNHEDQDGCPDPDNDGDQVLDADDLCSDEPSGERPDPDNRGCPLRDRDRDEVLDADDQCPEEAVGVLADPRRRGCPLPDRDRDAVGDTDDQCPGDPAGERPDRFRRGCPDPDRDHDGVPNETDACPADAETINGVNDADGCADAGDESVTLGRGAVLFANVLRLPSGARTLRRADALLLAQAAQRLRGLGAELARVIVTVVPAANDREGREALRLASLVTARLSEGGVSATLLEPRALAASATGSSAPRRSAVGEVRITILRNAPAR
jgi:OOP family OmpA-OmpF porin